MGLVADDQVPVGLLQFGLGIFVPAERVEAANGQRTSLNQLPVLAASRASLVMISNGRWNWLSSSSCHCSTRLPGHTMRQR